VSCLKTGAGGSLPAGTETTFYIGGLLEKESPAPSGATQWRHYVYTPSGTAILVMRDSIGGTWTRYLLTDHLGSSDTVLDPSGNVIVRESFAAFGARRGSDWSSTTPPDWAGIANTSRHGFTGHEHLDNLLLIHMNGRVYDPGTGRFLSVDPLMGDLTDSQQVNAYAYVGNRPLRFTDPSGLSAADEQDSSDVNYSFYVHVDISAKGVGRWFHRVGSGIAHFLGFGPGEPPPPASVMNRQSAESGLKMCGPGQSSDPCTGVVPYSVADLELLDTSVDVSAGFGDVAMAVISVGSGDAAEWRRINQVGSVDTESTAYNVGYWSAVAVSAGLGRFFSPVTAESEVAAADSVAAAKGSMNAERLVMTHGRTLSRREFNLLKSDIAKNGIKDTIKYVEVNGKNYIVDGHHRLMAARELGIGDVPVEKVELPFGDYKTVDDLFDRGW
jgi:RHS repeat-associated protein